MSRIITMLQAKTLVISCMLFFTFVPAYGLENVYAQKDSPQLKIIFIDVEKGSAALILLPNGKTILIDGGGRAYAERIISIIKEQGIDRVDMIIASHPHPEHIGGMPAIINSTSVEEVLDSGQVVNEEYYQEYANAISTKNIPVKIPRAGYEITLDPTVKIEVLHPAKPTPIKLTFDHPADTDAINNHSLVVKLTYGEFTALFTGDILNGAISQLLNTYDDLRVDVLSAPHHGTAGAVTFPFVSETKPEAVVISNGLPSEEGDAYSRQVVTDRIQFVATDKIFATVDDGDIKITTAADGDYTIETGISNKVVSVPEFNRAGALLVINALMVSLVIFFFKRNMISRLFKGL